MPPPGARWQARAGAGQRDRHHRGWRGGGEGIATALQLRQAGLEVLLLDPGPPAAGASSGNAGVFAVSEVLPLAEPGVLRKVPGWALDPLGPLAVRWRHLPTLLPWLLRFVAASRPSRVAELSLQLASLLSRVNRGIEALLGDTPPAGMWRRQGALAVYPSGAALRRDLPRWEERGKLGVRWEACTPHRVAQEEPALRMPWQHAVAIPDWSHVDDPYLFSLGLFERFVAAGGVSDGTRWPSWSGRASPWTVSAGARNLRRHLGHAILSAHPAGTG